jgi:osmotically-inducible protein OsmY
VSPEFLPITAAVSGQGTQAGSRDDLPDIVESVLARSDYFSGKNMRFEVHEDRVILRGVVRSYYHKQLAKNALKSISGLRRIHNEIEVVMVSGRAQGLMFVDP